MGHDGSLETIHCQLYYGQADLEDAATIRHRHVEGDGNSNVIVIDDVRPLINSLSSGVDDLDIDVPAPPTALMVMLDRDDVR